MQAVGGAGRKGFRMAGGGGEGQPKDHKVQIIVAVIGAIALVAAALIEFWGDVFGPSSNNSSSLAVPLNSPLPNQSLSSIRPELSPAKPSVPFSTPQFSVESLTGEYYGEMGVLDAGVRDTMFLSINVSRSGELTGALSGIGPIFGGDEALLISGKVSGNRIMFTSRLPIEFMRKRGFDYEGIPEGAENLEIVIVWYGEISEKLISGKWKIALSRIDFSKLSPQDKLEYSEVTAEMLRMESQSYWRIER